ncbi:MAG: hypothetical protein ACOYMN_06290 [Roseimicrobium sp.]
MKSQRIGIHLVSVLLLLLWGGVMLYFYASGRIVHYLPPDGIFRPMVLWGGIGMLVIGLYNLATIGAPEAACCEHDHGESHKHNHEAANGCCGHDHGHGHEHHHGDACAHEPKHDHGCCGHDHHEHHHHHAHAHGEEHGPEFGHAHGILEESGPFGRLIAILLIAVPVTYAAILTPDRYSANAVINKGLYSPSYGEGARSEQFSLNKDAATRPTPPAPGPAAKAGDVMPPVSTKEIEKQAQKAADPKSYGSFTLADLKAQVPQSPEGNFMLEVPELYYTAGDKEVQSVLNGQMVETIAQILPEKVNNDKGTRVRIFRLLVQCCAADARPYSIPVEFGKTPPSFKDMSWVKVIGKMTYKTEGEQTVPMLEATSMSEAAEPADKMVY